MKVKFQIQWGYSLLYSRRHYHPRINWSGRIECLNGKILSISLLQFPYLWWGPCQSPKRTTLNGNAWISITQRGIEGIEVEADVSDGGIFKLLINSIERQFDVSELLASGRIVIPVGQKYSHNSIIITVDGHLWYRDCFPRDGQFVPLREITGGNLVQWGRMTQIWLDPDERGSFFIDFPGDPIEESGCQNNLTLNLHVMAARRRGDVNEFSGEYLSKYPFLKNLPESQFSDYYPIALEVDNVCIRELNYYLRWHDPGVQMLQDIWIKIPRGVVGKGRRKVSIHNKNKKGALLLECVRVHESKITHLGMTGPQWTRVGDVYIISVSIIRETAIDFTYNKDVIECLSFTGNRLTQGFHSFSFRAKRSAVNVEIFCFDELGGAGKWNIDIIYQIGGMIGVMNVGFDLTTVPHDDCGDMDWILAYVQRYQVGDLVVFRPFTPATSSDNYRRWGDYCRNNDISVMAAGGYQDGALIASSADKFMGAGGHELSFPLYAEDPDDISLDMKDATRRYIEYIAERVKVDRKVTPIVSYGDASGGHRYSLLAGVDFLRAETMVQHTTLHLSQARGAAKALGSGKWGVHIAMQHGLQPNTDCHSRMYFLSLAQAWIMGAHFAYEEDSLFLMFKEERQCWSDKLTSDKRAMTKEFYRFSRTHPRIGEPDTAIGIVLGRYAAPFNGFVCGCEQSPSYSIWGKFGRSSPGWGHEQPEKGFHLLNVLAPGMSVHPLYQSDHLRSMFFSGSRYGDFDQIPIEASVELLKKYRLLLFLGWNTAELSDIDKIRDSAMAGSSVFISIPQLSKNISRDLLFDMDQIDLMESDEISSLCGLSVIGKKQKYSGRWTSLMPEVISERNLSYSRLPNRSEDEDGDCYLAEVRLAGAEVVVVDSESGDPILTRMALGRGYVYLLSVFAYPGHEKMKGLSEVVVDCLAHLSLDRIRVFDPSCEVYWCVWRLPTEECFQIYFINTDWTTSGNDKNVDLFINGIKTAISVIEGSVKIVTALPFCILYPNETDAHVEIINCQRRSATVRIHSFCRLNLLVKWFNGHVYSAKVHCDLDVEVIDAPERQETAIKSSLSVAYFDLILSIDDNCNCIKEGGRCAE